MAISTKNQPFLYLLKNGLIEVPDFVDYLPNCWRCRDIVLPDLWWKHNSLSVKTIFIYLFSENWPCFSIAHARNIGQLTALIAHHPMFARKIKPQPFWHKPPCMETISQIIRSVAYLFQVVQRWPFLPKSAIFISPQKWLDRSTRFSLFFTKLLGDGVGMLSYLFCNESSQFQLENYFLFVFFSENDHILALRMREISVKWPH